MSASPKELHSREPEKASGVAAPEVQLTGPKSPEKTASPAAEDEGIAAPEPGDDFIEADDESDAGYETDTASATSTSLSSSVRDYAFENGRRYHKFREGTYQFPNDEPEQAREDMKHAMIVNVCNGRLHFAPIPESAIILDAGTGTGIWSIDMGDEYPAATILGIDLSPIQPEWVPPNVKFMVDDVENPWLHGDNHFDYVHFRHVLPTLKDPLKVLSEAYRSIKPGGWIEFQEQHYLAFSDDGTVSDNFELNTWWRYIAEGLAVFGQDMYGILRLQQLLTDAGFVNIETRIVKLPIGPWAKDKTLRTVGQYCRFSLEDGLEALSLGVMTRGLKWTPDEVRIYLIGVKKALLDRSVHSYMPYHIVYGQKPLH